MILSEVKMWRSLGRAMTVQQLLRAQIIAAVIMGDKSIGGSSGTDGCLDPHPVLGMTPERFDAAPMCVGAGWASSAQELGHFTAIAGPVMPGAVGGSLVDPALCRRHRVVSCLPAFNIAAAQKSVQRPLYSQSPWRVGSGPAGPPISRVAGTCCGPGGIGAASGGFGSRSADFSGMTKMWQTPSSSQVPRPVDHIRNSDRNHFVGRVLRAMPLHPVSPQIVSEVLYV
jgi:hypothetical protein